MICVPPFKEKSTVGKSNYVAKGVYFFYKTVELNKNSYALSNYYLCRIVPFK